MLSKDVRMVINHFLQERSYGILDSNDPLYKTFLANRDEVSEYFANAGIELVVDEYYGIIFSQNLTDNELPNLISPRKISVFDTALLIILREIFQEKTNRGDNLIMTDIQTLGEQLQVLVPAENSQRMYQDKLLKSITKFVERRILTPAKRDDERFIISPIVRHILSIEKLEEIKEGIEKL